MRTIRSRTIYGTIKGRGRFKQSDLLRIRPVILGIMFAQVRGRPRTYRATMRATHLIAALTLAAAFLAPATSYGSDAADGEVVEQQDRQRSDRRTFQGRGFHAHFDIGAAYGQQVLEVSTIDAATLTGETDEERAVAGGLGIASSLHLWPIYGRFGGIGGYAEGQVGALRRNGAGTAVFSGSTGIIASAGLPRLKMMVSLGRSRRAGAYGDSNNVSTTSVSMESEITAGAADIRAHRLGLGLRAPLGGAEQRGIDIWVFFDDPVDAGPPAVALPNIRESAISMRGSFWMRNAFILSAEVVMRGAALDSTVAGTRLTERTAMVMMGWSMDRFSRPYGG
ncbi:MAG: hypothetical protein ACJAYU_004078 [Bradymonadia bacterium]